MRVDVYRNLHTEGLYSVRSAETGLVSEDHRPVVVVKNADFHVSAAGRARVLASGQKEVHAWVRGEDVAPSQFANGRLPMGGVQINYNPRLKGTFYRVDTGEPVYGALLVVMRPYGRIHAFGLK